MSNGPTLAGFKRGYIVWGLCSERNVVSFYQAFVLIFYDAELWRWYEVQLRDKDICVDLTFRTLTLYSCSLLYTLEEKIGLDMIFCCTHDRRLVGTLMRLFVDFNLVTFRERLYKQSIALLILY